MEKPGSRTQTATVITVSPGKPEQLASLTCSAATAEVEREPGPSEHHRPMSASQASQPGRALRPIIEAPTSADPNSKPQLSAEARLLSVQPAPSAPVPGGDVSPLRLLYAFRRCWFWAVGLGLLAAAVVGPTAWFLLPPPQFTAEADLQVFSRAPVVAFSTAETSQSGNEDYKRYQKTQVALLKSRPVLQSALQKPEISKLRLVREPVDPVQWLKDHLEASFPSESEILHIALKGESAEEVAKMVNAVTQAYMDEVVNVELKRRTQRYDKLNEIVAKKLQTLKSQRERVRNLAESLGSNNQQALVLKQQLAAENQAQLDKELLEIRSKRRRAEAELAARLRLVETVADAPAAVDEAEIEALLDQEPTVAALQQQLDETESALRHHTTLLNKTARNPGADPALNQLRTEIRRVRNELAERRKALRPFVVKKYQSTAGDGKAGDSVASLRREIEVMEDMEKRVEAERSKIVVQAKTDNTRNLDLQTITDEIEESENTANKMRAEIQSLEIELEAPRRIQIIEQATVPIVDDSLKRNMMIAMATLGAFAASVLGITFWELQSKKVSSATDVAGGLGLRLLGTLPALPVRARNRNLERSRSQDAILERMMHESVDMTRTMLLNATHGGGGRVVMITSAMSGEGKTSLSCHLGTSMARSGRRTVLIDADLRNPSINRLFDQPREPGLSDLLRGDLSVEEVVARTSVADLDVIPAGAYDRATMRSLSQGGIAPLLERLRDHYDCIVIDTAPVLSVTDTLLIAPHADAVILAVLTDVSRAHRVSEAHHRLATIGARVLGAVFTGDRANVYGMDYRYHAAGDQAEEEEEEEREVQSTDGEFTEVSSDLTY